MHIILTFPSQIHTHKCCYHSLKITTHICIITRQKSHFVWSTYCSTTDIHRMGKVHIIEQEQDRIQSVVFPGLALLPCPVT